MNVTMIGFDIAKGVIQIHAASTRRGSRLGRGDKTIQIPRAHCTLSIVLGSFFRNCSRAPLVAIPVR